MPPKSSHSELLSNQYLDWFRKYPRKNHPKIIFSRVPFCNPIISQGPPYGTSAAFLEPFLPTGAKLLAINPCFQPYMQHLSIMLSIAADLFYACKSSLFLARGRKIAILHLMVDLEVL